MSGSRLVMGLVLAFDLVAGPTITAAQPSAERAKQRAEAGAKVTALLREGKFAEAIGPATKCAKLSREIDGPKHWRTFDAEHTLKLAEAAAGLTTDKQKALVAALTAEENVKKAEITAPEKALAIARSALEMYDRAFVSEETVEIAQVLHAVGRIEGVLGNTNDAKAMNERALAIRRKLLPVQHPDLGRSLNNLALLQANLGDRKEAAEGYRKAVCIWKAGLGADDPLVAFGLTNLGLVQHDLRDLEGARRSHQEALAIRRKALPKDHPDIASTLNNLGLVQRDLRDLEGARKSHQEALDIRRKMRPTGHSGVAMSLNNLGLVQRDLRDLEGARKSHQEALDICRKALPAGHPGVAMSLNNLGNAQYDLRDLEGARKSHEEALAIRRKALPKDHPDIASTLNNLGVAQHDLRDLEGARKSHQEALDICRKALPAGHPGVAMSLNNLGNAQHDLRDLEGARKSHQEALAIRRKALPKDHPDIASTLNNLGLVQRDLRDLEGARKSHQEALDIRRKMRPAVLPDIASTLNNLGVAHRDLRDLEGARRSHEEALAIRRKALPAGHPDIAMSLNNLGNAQHDLRDLEGARKSHQEALDIRRKMRPAVLPDIAMSLNNLGNAQHDLRDLEGARKSHQEALDIHRKMRPAVLPDIASTLNNLGAAQGMLGELKAARESHEEALAIRRKALPKDHPDIALSLTNLGVVQHELRELEECKRSYREALDIYRKALPAGHPDIARSLNNLGVLQCDLRDLEGARKSHEEALDICRKALPKDHPDISLYLYNICLVDIVSHSLSHDTIRLAGESLAINQVNLSRLANSQAEAEQLSMAAEAQRAISLYLSVVLDPGRDASTTYHRIGAFKGAVAARQRWARALRDPKDPTTADLLRQLTVVDRQLLAAALPSASGEIPCESVDLKTYLQGRRERRAELERLLSERSAAYQVFRTKGELGGDDIRAAVPECTTLLDFREYWHICPPTKGRQEPVTEQRLLAFVVRPGKGGVTLVPLGRSEPIAQLVDRWRSTQGSGRLPTAGNPDPAVELRKAVWEPLAKHLGDGVKTVLISPDGPLHGLPFAALPGDEENKFLLHKYAFAVVPVPILLPEVLAKKTVGPSAPRLLLAGGIDFGQPADKPALAPTDTRLPRVPTYDRLPGSKSEVNDLRAQFEETFPDAPAPKVLRGELATKTAFVDAVPKKTFLHLATHGFFAAETEKSALDTDQRPVRGFQMDRFLVGRHPGLLSGVVFAGVNAPGTPKEQAILTALEAGELDLSNAELVVLSACDTGRGKVAGGEGVLGLQRGLQTAGAQTVVASLWAVKDEHTHQLMREFYSRLWDTKKNVSKAEALRQAQLWMLTNSQRGGLRPEGQDGKEVLPPHFWAAFVLSGDWR
ncbi:photosystem I assembly protein Ycf3 [Gemmata obscuriglobus]|uniref:CHAT domain-containing protein n=1 Tax=Gemmata obscuriglobus TaxID=114 RepID=A0A2Z3HB16_9BACT|nr:CHAT domain-containing tetratricopeptide repeat protein [Gemmata obscuriglobus]AWM40145.1 hypothetical protein C1280_26160 [Gemmata obscuriglobus]QEG26679.1 photosystem I assembly protein Ycf3 [Gemmata obscuriglobus]VTS02326.1 kinesin light chain-like protein : TPR repeat OS=Trichodesmium erythraeum (strain IMS101) GN=Tery_0977 PE=4 SV=1: TPR_12: TPR_12: TPR_12: TPR_12: TPR_12: TPR_12: TPR_12: CHAT [Gemmata obscuriglobus UQM 2246]